MQCRNLPKRSSSLFRQHTFRSMATSISRVSPNRFLSHPNLVPFGTFQPDNRSPFHHSGTANTKVLFSAHPSLDHCLKGFLCSVYNLIWSLMRKLLRNIYKGWFLYAAPREPTHTTPDSMGNKKWSVEFSRCKMRSKFSKKPSRSKHIEPSRPAEEAGDAFPQAGFGWGFFSKTSWHPDLLFCFKTTQKTESESCITCICFSQLGHT